MHCSKSNGPLMMMKMMVMTWQESRAEVSIVPARLGRYLGLVIRSELTACVRYIHKNRTTKQSDVMSVDRSVLMLLQSTQMIRFKYYGSCIVCIYWNTAEKQIHDVCATDSMMEGSGKGDKLHKSAGCRGNGTKQHRVKPPRLFKCPGNSRCLTLRQKSSEKTSKNRHEYALEQH